MRKEKKLLISELQARLVPFFVEHGFQQTPLSGGDRKSREIMLMLPLGVMKRTRADKLDLLEIQLHPRRTTFVLAFGRVPPEGASSPWAKPSQAEVSVADLRENCRLYANRSSMAWFGLPWFSFGQDAAAAITKAIRAVIELYPEVEEYFRSGVVGPHIKCIRYTRDASGNLTAEVRTV